MRDNAEKLYHLADKDCLNSILQKGLIAQKGKNSNIIDEEYEAVFLCERKDVDCWSILLDKHVLLEVTGIRATAFTPTL